jgi:hypothetical protein
MKQHMKPNEIKAENKGQKSCNCSGLCSVQCGHNYEEIRSAGSYQPAQLYAAEAEHYFYYLQLPAATPKQVALEI